MLSCLKAQPAPLPNNLDVSSEVPNWFWKALPAPFYTAFVDSFLKVSFLNISSTALSVAYPAFWLYIYLGFWSLFESLIPTTIYGFLFD